MSNRSTGEVKPDDGSHHGWVEYRSEEAEPPSVAVASAIAEFNGKPATETDIQLYDYVDPDALDALFEDRHDGNPRGAGTIRFAVDGATVVVSPETIRVFDNCAEC